MSGVVLDAGALIAVERGDRAMDLLVKTAVRERHTLMVPATVLAQVSRDPARQARLMRLLAAEASVVDPLDRTAAREVGKLLAASGTSDIADAHVALCAQSREWSVATSDPQDLRRLDPELELIPV